jgi:hypothetical protein
MVALVPTQDAIQEFDVQSNNISPEFGKSAGGIVNMTTKSGTNDYHLELYDLDPAHSGRGFWSQCWVDRAFGSFLTFRDNLTFGEVIPKCAIHLEICGSPVITRGSRISAASTSFVNFYECCNSAISWLTSLHIHAAIADTVYRR